MNQAPLRWWRVWLALGFAGCAVLVYTCMMPSPPQPNVPGFDKIEHFLAYLALAAWFAEILPRRPVRVFIGLALLGLAIELAQAMTDYRSGDVLDFVADVAGIGAGIELARLGAMRWLDYIDGHVLPARNRA